MFSLRFPFLFSPPSTPNLPNPNPNSNSNPFSSTAIAFAGLAASFAITKTTLNNFSSNNNNSSPVWASISLSDNSSTNVTEPKTSASFPSVIKESQRLLGVGLRRKTLFGLKNIDVYAFGVYANDDHVKKLLSEKLKESKGVNENLMESDIAMTVRLQIVYGRLSIRSVRNAFEESVGNRLQKFGGSDNKELLQRFTSQFKDEYKLPRGSVIDLSREEGHVRRTTIDGKEVGSIQSKLLCRSILDLYIGDDPFDAKAKENVEANLVSLIQK